MAGAKRLGWCELCGASFHYYACNHTGRTCSWDCCVALKRAAAAQSVRERFLSFIDRTSGSCWLWTGCVVNPGYGQISVGGQRQWAHRVSYELHIGAIADDMCVCHRCDVRTCVNPAHLFLATKQGNAVDMSEKGRSTWGAKNHHAKLTADDVRRIRYAYKRDHAMLKDAARELGITVGHAKAIGRRVFWKHIA